MDDFRVYGDWTSYLEKLEKKIERLDELQTILNAS